MHTGATYAGDLSQDGLLYHYPRTQGRGLRDAGEVEATKNAHRLQLPLFVVVGDRPQRDVFLGWVAEWADESAIFLIDFGESPAAGFTTLAEDLPFELRTVRRRRTVTTTARPGQHRFRYSVIKRYGLRCAVCNVAVDRLLEAAHLCSVECGGSDDPRNGILLCVNHHRAFDDGLFAIEPASGHIVFRDGWLAEPLGVLRKTIEHLERRPHHDALTFVWDVFRDNR